MQSGTFNIASGASCLYLIVEWTETAVNTTANTSTVSVTLKLHHGGLSVAAGADDCSLTLGGTTQKWTGPNIYQSGVNTKGTSHTISAYTTIILSEDLSLSAGDTVEIYASSAGASAKVSVSCLQACIDWDNGF